MNIVKYLKLQYLFNNLFNDIIPPFTLKSNIEFK